MVQALGERTARAHGYTQTMPELPDVTVYIEALEARVLGKRLERVKLMNPFILRTAVPPIASAEGKRVTGMQRVRPGASVRVKVQPPPASPGFPMGKLLNLRASASGK